MTNDNQELITNLLCREIEDLKLTLKLLQDRYDSLKLSYDEAIQSIQAGARGTSTDDVLRLLQLHDCTTSGLFGGLPYSQRGSL